MSNLNINMNQDINIIKDLYKVTGVIFDKNDNRQSFERYTYAVSNSKAISNIVYHIRKESKSNCRPIIRDMNAIKHDKQVKQIKTISPSGLIKTEALKNPPRGYSGTIVKASNANFNKHNYSGQLSLF